MKYIFSILSVVTLLWGAALPASLHAQGIADNAVFYHSIRSPWSNAYNPALFPESSGWYLTTAKVGLQLSLPLSYEELNIQYDPERDVSVLDVNEVLNQLKANGCNLYNNNDINLLGFGFSIGESLHLSASAGLRTQLSLNVPTGLIDFATQGNVSGDNHLEFGDENILCGQVFAYTSVGTAFKMPAIPLTIGGRLNILDGIANLSADNLSVTLHTEEDMSALRLSSDYLMHTAGIATDIVQNMTNGDGSLGFDPDSLRAMMPTNMGFTFDLGAKFEVGIFDISLSLVDLGPGIRWSQKPITIVPKQKDISVAFSGVDLSTAINQGTIDTAFVGRLKDSLMAMIDYTQTADAYWSAVPTRLYAGASASVGKCLKVGYLFQGQWRSGWRSSFACNNTFSAHLNLFNWLELSVANSFTYNGQSLLWLNPGCAFTLSLAKRLQLFVATEYISGMSPEKIKAAHIVAGINFVGLR